jgi:hypothetical protein
MAAWQLFSSDSPRLDGLTINLGGNSSHSTWNASML